MRINSVISAALLLTASATAQSLALLGAAYPGATPQPDDYAIPVEHLWSEGMSVPGLVRRTMPARLTRHSVPDVVVLKGGSPALVVAPGIHEYTNWLFWQANSPSPGFVNDIAVLAGQGKADGSEATYDALAFVGNYGLRIWRFVPGQAAVGTTAAVPPSYSITVVGGSEWNGVQFLAVHPNHSDVIFGMTASGNGLIATRTGTTYSTDTAASTAFSVTSPPIAMTCIDWSGSGSKDVAILTGTELSVHGQNGALIPNSTFASPGLATGALTRVHSAALLPKESIAWLRPEGVNGHKIEVHSSVRSFDVPLPAGEGFVGVAAGDWTADGNEELVVSTEENVDVTVMINLAAAAWPSDFIYSAAYAVEVAVAATANGPRSFSSCAPAVADFDADGDADLVAAIESDAAHGPSHTLVDCTVYHWTAAAPLMSVTVGYEEEVILEPIIESSLTFAYGIVPGSATHTQIIVWSITGDPVAETEALLGTPVHSMTYGNEAPQPINVPVSHYHIMHEGNYIYMLRPVRIEGGGIVEVGPATFGNTAFTIEDKDGKGAGNVIINPSGIEEPLPPPEGEGGPPGG